MQSEWNIHCKKPLAQWLLHQKEEEDSWDERVHACGNIVVPAQAAAALQLLVRFPPSVSM